jgi:Ger(x)C family germination protein
MPRTAKIQLIIIIVILTVLNCGCWDREEIEERGFILGLGLDFINTEEGEGFSVTQQEADPKNIAGGEQSTGGTGKGAFYNITTFSKESIYDAIVESDTRMSHKPYYAHLRVIVIGEKMAKKGIIDALDLITRYRQIRDTVKIYVTPIEAKKILEIEPRIEPVNALYLARLAEVEEGNFDYSGAYIDIGDVVRRIHEDASFFIPRLAAGKNEVELIGAGLFKTDKLVGYLSYPEVNGILWSLNKVKKALVTIDIPFDDSEKAAVYSTDNNTTKTFIKLDENNDITYYIKVRNEGRLAENQKQMSIMKKEYIEELEKEVSLIIAERIRHAISLLQQKYRADVIDMGRNLQKRYPKYWDEIKDVWEEEIFPEVNINIEVQSFIRRVGVGR